MSILAHTLRDMLQSQGVGVYDYGERDDFDRLWAALDTNCAGISESTVVICWPQTAADPSVAPVASGPHITPLDWAACAASVRRDLVVDVINLRPQTLRNTPAMRVYERLDPARLSWLRILVVPDLLVGSREELESLFATRKRSGSDLAPADFLEMRRTALTDPGPLGDRHAITNIVGPIVLLGRTPGEVPGHAKALWHLLHQAGLLARAALGESARQPGCTKALRELAPIRLVLVDDQWRHGWAAWLSQRLDLPWDESRLAALRRPSSFAPECVAGDPQDGVSLWVSDTPEWILDRLTKVLSGNEESSSSSNPMDGDARFRLHITSSDASPNDVSEILLLDLRLFPPNSADEKSFVSRTVRLARRFTGEGRDRERPLAWPALSAKELDGVEQWTAPSGGEVERSVVLTLLPRLVAHSDMSLPIVLFSSTGRRDIVARLDGYDSVVSCFSKPRFFGDSTGIVEEANSALDEALAEAASLLRGRQRVTSIIGVQPQPVPAVHAGNYGHSALFIDESGEVSKPWFTVGGLLALYRNEGQERAFNDLLKEKGIHWGRQGLPKFSDAQHDQRLQVHEAEKEKRRAQRQQVCAHVLELAENQGVALHVIALAVENPMPRSGQAQAWPEQHLDYLHRVLVRLAAEAALFHIIPSGQMRAPWTFALLTDVRACPQATLTAETLRVLNWKFGLWAEPHDTDARKWHAIRELADLPDGGNVATAVLVAATKAYKETQPRAVEAAERTWRIPFLNRSGVFPILDDLLHQYEAVQRLRDIRVVEAQGCHLPEGRDSALKPPNRCLHYLADWVVGEVRESLRDGKGGDTADWIKRMIETGGLIEVFGPDTVEHLRFARYAMAGEVARAAASFIRHPPGKASSLKDRCARAVVNGLRMSPGSVFVDACRKAEAMGSDGQAQPRLP